MAVGNLEMYLVLIAVSKPLKHMKSRTIDSMWSIDKQLLTLNIEIKSSTYATSAI